MHGSRSWGLHREASSTIADRFLAGPSSFGEETYLYNPDPPRGPNPNPKPKPWTKKGAQHGLLFLEGPSSQLGIDSAYASVVACRLVPSESISSQLDVVRAVKL